VFEEVEEVGGFTFALLQTQIHAHTERYVFSGFTFAGPMDSGAKFCHYITARYY
jgi:hypothetical protein